MFCRFLALDGRSSFPTRAVRSIPALVLALSAAMAVPAGATLGVPSSGMIGPPQFSPNGNGVLDTTVVKWTLSSATSRLVLRIHRTPLPLAGDTVRTIDFGPRPTGPDSLIWDGRTDAGAIAPEGTYRVAVAESLFSTEDTTSSQVASIVTLDVTPPRAPVFSSPPSDSFDTTEASLDIEGNALGASRVTIFLNGAIVGSFRPVVSPTDSLFGFDAGTVTLAAGWNEIVGESEDAAGNRPAGVGVTHAIYRNTADVTDLRASPSSFSPNGDGASDSTEVSFDLDVATSRLEVQIRRAQAPPLSAFAADSALVRLYDQPAVAGSFTLVWDGRDSTGVLAGEGGYFFFVRAESLGTDGAPRVGSPHTRPVTLDITPPGAPVVSPPLPSRTQGNTLDLAATSSGAVNIILTQNSSELLPRPGNPLRRTVDLALGSNPFTFQGADAAGNLSPIVGPIVVVREEPLGFHAPERFTTGDVFQVNLSAAPRSLKLEIRTLSGRSVRTLSSSSSSPQQELVWNLRDDEGNTVGNGPYVARLTVTYLDGSTDGMSGAVVVVK